MPGNIPFSIALQDLSYGRKPEAKETLERLRVGIPNAFGLLLSHTRQLKFDDDGPSTKVFMDNMEPHGYSTNTHFEAGGH